MSVEGSIFGLAYGDALGKPTEFMPFKAIIERYHDNLGPSTLPKGGRVTDDTQMMIYTGEGIVHAAQTGYLTAGHVARCLEVAYVDWMGMTDGSRAPGGTCLAACRKLTAGESWLTATDANSKGCGANMRVTPVGLATWQRRTVNGKLQIQGFLSTEEAAGIAQLQSAITHGHPTALAASDATAHVTWLALTGTPVTELVPALLAYCRTQRTIYHRDWLGTLWTRTHRDRSPETFIRRGWDEVISALVKVRKEWDTTRSRTEDPCRVTGAGWVAEEALATALRCTQLYPDDAVRAVRRGAASSGDSDSIAAITGGIMGAAYGLDAFPRDWHDRIEYRDRLTKLAADLI